MQNKDDYILLSQLTQAAYCPRRAALIMNEQLWQDSPDTVKGHFEHERVHEQRTEKRANKIMLYEQEVYSDALKITGKCDLVEAVKDENGSIYLNEKGRREVLSAWRDRKQEEITHPFLNEKITIGLIPCTQAMLFARMLRGDLDQYPPFIWR